MNTTTNFLSAYQPLSLDAASATGLSTASSIVASTLASSDQRRVSCRPSITPREKEVLYLIAYEHTAKEIASILFISYETVNSHRKNIMIKLDVKNTAGMVRVAFEKNILHTL